MDSIAPSPLPAVAELAPPECLPNYDLIITEDGKPLDNLYSERQLRLLTDVLAGGIGVRAEIR